MATRKNHLFKFRRILLPVTAAENRFSSYPAVYFRSLLRRNFTFLYFRRILPPVTAAENRFSSYPAVYFRSLLRRKFVFLHFHRTLAPCSTAGILLSSFPPYTCALSYGRNSPFFIFCRALAPYPTAEIHFFHFPAVHLLSFLRRNFAFLHFPPYTSILSCRRISPSMAFSPKSLQKILPRHFLPYCHIKNYFLRQLFSTSNPGKFTPASYLTPGKLSSQRLPAPPGR